MSEGIGVADWPQKYRPVSFAQVIGEDRLKQAVARAQAGDNWSSILLHGPSGTGKTTLGRLYAKAVLCEHDGRLLAPCNTCRECTAFDDSKASRVHILEPGRQSTQGVRRLVESLSEGATRRAAREVVIVDDADDLAGWRYLKSPLEAVETPTIFIFAVEDANRAPAAIRDRLENFHLVRPSRDQLVQALMRIADAEGLGYGNEVLHEVAREASNHRQAVALLQAIAVETEGSGRPVQRVIAEQRAWLDLYLSALAKSDLPGQIEALRASGRPPREVVRAILQAVLDVRLGRDAGDEPINPEASYRRTGAWFGAAAKARGISTPTLWDRMISYWAHIPAPDSDEQLQALALAFSDQLSTDTNEPSLDLAARTMPATRHRRPANRRSAERGLSADRDYLTFDQAAALYEAATFALQVYGAAFNTKIQIVWSASLGAGVGPAIDRFAHALQRRLESLGCEEVGGKFLRLLLNRTDPDGRRITDIVAHVPARHRASLERWLARSKAPGKVQLLHPPTTVATTRRVQIHWRLVRQLWAGLDPEIELEGYRVLDLLKVPSQDWAPLGQQFTRRRFSMSHALGDKAQARLLTLGIGHLSAMGDWAFTWVDTGWEIGLHSQWRQTGFNRFAEITISNRGLGSAWRGRNSQNVQIVQLKQRDIADLGLPPWRFEVPDHTDLDTILAEINLLFAEIDRAAADGPLQP